MKMVYRRKGKDRSLYNAEPAVFSFADPKKFRKKSFKIDLSEEVVVFRKIDDFDPSQIRYLCEQIAERMNELGFLAEKTPDQIFEKMERGDCLTLSSGMEALFFACLYEAAGAYVIDNLLIHNTCVNAVGDPFRRFLSFKAEKSGIGNFFGLAPRELKGGSQTLCNVFLATNGFALWDPREEDNKSSLDILKAHEGLGDLLEEAYWIFHREEKLV